MTRSNWPRCSYAREACVKCGSCVALRRPPVDACTAVGGRLTASGGCVVHSCSRGVPNLVGAAPLSGRTEMPVILWLLGVPLVVVVLLMLFNVV
jgi:hypothetical protein